MLTFKERLATQKIVIEQKKILSGKPPFKVKMAALKAKIEALTKLGIIGASNVQEQEQKPAKLFEFNPDRKKAERVKDNNTALALLDDVDSGKIDADTLTGEQKTALSKYSGMGGGLESEDGLKGSTFEYYTPKPIAEGMWNLASELGFNGGKVLDPSAGVGIFGGTAPKSAVVDAVELDSTSGRINQLINGDDKNNITVSNFEKVAASSEDEIYDAVMTNVPFAKDVKSRAGNQFDDKKYQKEPVENYFILRSLDKLKPNGLAVFITPPRIVSDKKGKPKQLRDRVSLVAEFLGAYRLPNSVFGTANADTISDIIVFRKFSASMKDKIDELRESNPQILSEAGVTYDNFLSGDYFKTDGKKYVLGEFKPKDPDKFMDVDRVITTKPISEISAMIKKFEKSRINWSLLDDTETAPILYSDGDISYSNGNTLQFKNNEWVVLEGANNKDIVERLDKLATPYKAFYDGITHEEAKGIYTTARSLNMERDMPSWLSGVVSEIKGDLWRSALMLLSVTQVYEENTEHGFNYFEAHKKLSDAMETLYSSVNSNKAKFPTYVRASIALYLSHYRKRDGFSKVWTGDVLESVEDKTLTVNQKIDKLTYKNQSSWLNIDEVTQAVGDEFDPISEAEWCVSSDGKNVIRADDYYVGNYQDFLTKIDKDIEGADGIIKDKLLRQKSDASDRLDIIDPKNMSFSLASPYVSINEKLEFLKKYVDGDLTLSTDTDEPTIVLGRTAKTYNDKIIKRYLQYIKNGTITLGSMNIDGVSRDKALEDLRKLVKTSNAQFTPYVRSNNKIIARIHQESNDPKKLRFRATDNTAPLEIEGVTKDKTPHSYQNAFIRKMGREFTGINAFGVGLGKTLTALLSVQHVQNIGVKKKTLFVVPSSVLANWREEAIGEKGIYTDKESSLFIGLRVDKNGKATIKSSLFDKDLLSVLENRHSKIFMSLEAFERIKLKSETVDKYMEYMGNNDASYSTHGVTLRADLDKIEGSIAVVTNLLGDKKGAVYLEDMGVDSIVIDEAHALKNSSKTSSTKSARFLSLSEPSKRGIDAQAKAWYIRSGSPLNDGVLLLTATPITNSPLEIYSMLALSKGADKINNDMVGINGADDFMASISDIENMADKSIDGIDRDINVFVGLNNVDLLRKTINSTADIKDSETVGGDIFVPEEDVSEEAITLPEEVNDRLVLYKNAFRYAIDSIADKSEDENRGNKADFEKVQAYFNESIDLIGHPFNLINKMTMLITDPELDKRQTIFLVEEAQGDIAKKVIEDFNAKKYKERRKPSPLTNEDMITVKYKQDKETGNTVEEHTIQIQAFSHPDRIIIDTTDSETQSKFEVIAEKAGLNLDVTVPAKLAAMISNVQQELANPRGIDSDGKKVPFAKQVIFSDILASHFKIRRLLTNRAGVKAAKIATITGKVNNEPESILAVSDGFNNNEDNKYQIILANKKAEVGINLQNGTQAVHHLTIGWTPDSGTQRNGRAVRQGNKTPNVKIYNYDADGTFDVSKRLMVGKKSEWIDKVISQDGGSQVEISGGLSNEKMQLLIDTVGDAEGTKRVQKQIEDQEAASRNNILKGRQEIAVDTIIKEAEYLKKYESVDKLGTEKLHEIIRIEDSLMKLSDKLKKAKTVKAKEKITTAFKALRDKQDGLISLYDEAFFTNKSKYTLLDDGGSISDGIIIIKNEMEFYDKSKIIPFTRRYFSRIKHETDKSTLGLEYQQGIEASKKMLKESIKSYNEISDANDNVKQGGMADAMLMSIEEDKEIPYIHNGNALVKNAVMLVEEYKDSFSLITSISSADDGYVKIMTLNETDNSTTESNFYTDEKRYTVHYKGSEEYQKAMEAFARYDDKRILKGKDAIFSEKNKDVEPFRKEVEWVSHFRDQSRLPSPYFPYVLASSAGAPSSSEFSTAVIEQHNEIIKDSSSNTSMFISPPDLEITNGQVIGKDKLDAAIDFCKSRGIKLSYNIDLGYFLGTNFIVIRDKLESFVDMDKLKSYLENISTDELDIKASEFILDASSSWLDYSKDNIGDAGLSNEIFDLISDIEQQREPDKEQEESPDDVMALTGDKTYGWKEEIKYYAEKYKPDSYKKAWGIDKSDGFAWLVSRKAAEQLAERYAGFSDDINVEKSDKVI